VHTKLLPTLLASGGSAGIVHGLPCPWLFQPTIAETQNAHGPAPCCSLSFPISRLRPGMSGLLTVSAARRARLDATGERTKRRDV